MYAKVFTPPSSSTATKKVTAINAQSEKNIISTEEMINSETNEMKKAVSEISKNELNTALTCALTLTTEEEEISSNSTSLNTSSASVTLDIDNNTSSVETEDESDAQEESSTDTSNEKDA
jgi:hypothetical protein